MELVNYINSNLISVRALREIPTQGILDFLQPVHPLIRRTGDDDAEHFPIDVLDSAESEYAVLPQRLERVCKNVLLALLGRVGGVKDKGSPRFQQPLRDAFALV